MPSRKQRKRREKSFRHEWEYVELDPETGEERPIAPAELKAEKPARGKRTPPKQQARRSGSRREPQPPSWRRVIKRTAMFAPLIALFIYLTSANQKHGVSVPKVILNTVVLVAFFAPFSYLVDRMTYRLWLKRSNKAQR
jgi:hypothetical protein